MIKEISTNWRPGGMRWAVYRFPSGHVERVLQQVWEREVTQPIAGGGAHMRVEQEWRDVPNYEMPSPL